jgi:hypothetical protein
MSLQTISSAPGFFHNVFFWLKEGAAPQDAQKLAYGCVRFLSDIPGVVRLTVGFPAGTAREVVDNSYGVALLVEFTDSQAQDVYQEHPEHLRFIAECSPLWSRVQVYDMLPLPDEP